MAEYDNKARLERELASQKQLETEREFNRLEVEAVKREAKSPKQTLRAMPKQSKRQKLRRVKFRKIPASLSKGVVKLLDTSYKLPKSKPRKIMKPQTSMNISNTNYRESVAIYERERERNRQEIISKNKQLSENSKAILSRLMRIQNKGLSDRQRISRILREKKIISESGNILKTPSLFSGKQDIDISALEVPELNPLRAENLFSTEKELQHKFRPRRFSILATREAGNDIQW